MFINNNPFQPQMTGLIMSEHFTSYFDAQSNAEFIALVDRFPAKMQERGYFCQITERSTNCQDYASFNILVSKKGHPTGDMYQMLNSGKTVTAKFIGKVQMAWE